MFYKVLMIVLVIGVMPVAATAQTTASILDDSFITSREYIDAEVVRVSTANRTLTVKGAMRGQTRTFTVDEGVRVSVNGRQARLRDIRRGDEVRLVMRPNAGEVVVATVQVPETPISLETRQANPVVATTADDPVQLAEVRPTVLPSTASSLPMTLVLGLIALLGAAVIRIRRRAS